MKKFVSLLSISIFLSLTAFGQNKDKAIFKEYEAGYYQNFILKDVRNVEKINTKKEKDKRFLPEAAIPQLALARGWVAVEKWGFSARRASCSAPWDSCLQGGAQAVYKDRFRFRL